MLVTLSKNRLLSISLLLFVGGLVITGCSKPKTSYDYLTQARQERDKGDDQAALIDLKNALKKDPKNGEARLLFAQMLNERGEGPSAEIEVRKAVELGVNKSFAAAILGEALLLQKQYQKVLDEITVANGDKGKLAADIYNVRGDAYIGLIKNDEAKIMFENALKEYEDSTDAYLGMARLAALSSDFNEAMRQTEIALSKDPNSTKGWLIKARLLRAQEKDEDARTAYEHILKIDTKNVSALLGLASIDIAQNKFDAAKTQLNTALKIAPNTLSARYALGVIEFQDRKFKEAQESVQGVLKNAPDYSPAILLRGAVAYAQKAYEQANSDVSRVLAQNPGNAYARRLLAATQLKLGEPSKALDTLNPLLKPQLADAGALALAGEAQLLAKNYDKATEYLQKAIEINPQAKQLQTQLAISRLNAGDTGQAIKELEEVTKEAPGESLAGTLLVVTQLQRKEFDKALIALTHLEKTLGPNPVTYNLRGTALLGQHDFSNARKAFEQALAIQPTYFPAVANLARLDLLDNKPDEARKRLESALDKDKNNIQAMLALADLAHNQKHEEEYVHWLEKAREAQPKAILAYLKLADYYLAKKETAKALDIANKAAQASPNNPAALSVLGATQLAVGDKEGALSTSAKLVKRAPDAASSYLQLALAQLAANKENDARASLMKSLNLTPDLQKAQDILIRLDLKEERGDEALKIAREMQGQHPASPVGYDREAEIFMARKKYSQAADAFGRALARDKSSLRLINMVSAMILAGDNKTADERLISWIKQNPKDSLVRGYAADYYLSTNRNQEAILQYEALLKLAPHKRLAPLNNLANLYQRQGDSRRAIATAEEALKLAPDNPVVQDTLGWILVGQGQLPRALQLLHTAASKAPEAGSIHYHLAVALDRSDQKSEAKKELEAAISAGQKFPELDDAKALLKNM